MSMSSVTGARSADRIGSTSAVLGKSTAIHYWAAVGAFFIVLQVYIFARWIGSEHFTPAPIGDTPQPQFQQYVMWLFQSTVPLFMLGGWAWIAWQARRDGRLPAYGLIMLGWASVYWQDPLINYVRPSFSYSSYWVNFGSWCELVPGWLSPNGSKMPEPLLFGAGAYAFFVPISALICLGWMRLAKRLVPSINTLGLIGVALVSMFVTDMLAEGTMVLTGVYSYLGVIHSLSIFDGELHQFPLYESLLGGGCAAATGSLLYFRDDKGNMLVERGLENLKRKRGNELLRVLAVSGFVNIVVSTYTVLFIFLNLQLDAFPKDVPSYFLNGVCGKGTDYECPGPDVAIPLKSSGPLPPFTGRN
ncbi:MAG TPA: spirocyclase AveC family protein [Polyangiales bacterium]|nr:spirocyclase AveC family protein [Polyangiales bacterium]